MSATAEHFADLLEAGYLAEPTPEEMTSPMCDPHLAAIDAHLEALAAADEADGRWEERLMHLGNLAFVVANYDLKTGKLHPISQEVKTP